MTPQRAVRQFCTECVAEALPDVHECGGDQCLNGGCDANGVCLFFKYRLGAGRPTVKLIRRVCLWCMGDHGLSPEYVKECHAVSCPLHRYRMGTNPRRKGVGGNAEHFGAKGEQ